MKTHSNRVGIRTCSDYSPFGVELDGRTVSVEWYRFGYQGSEKDNEFKGEGNSYTTEFRQLDTRIGRWLSIDPVIQPWQSSYCSMDGNPISKNDILGNTTKDWIKRQGKDHWEYDSGIQSAGEAKTRYGNNTEYKDDGETYPGEINGESIGSVTLNNGGMQTWEKGSHQNPDINPNPSPSSNYSPETNMDLNIVKPEVAFLFYAKLEREEMNRIESYRSAFYSFCDVSQKAVSQGLFVIGTGGLTLEAASAGVLTSAIINSSINFIGQYSSGKTTTKVDYASTAITFGTSLLSNPWISASINTLLDASLDIDGNGDIDHIFNKSSSKFSYDLFFGGISNFSGATLNHLNIKSNLEINKSTIEIRNGIMNLGSQFLNTEVNKQ
ncbi:MAG: hypothetical protein RIS20_2004 [Bacteroidota bacterium]